MKIKKYLLLILLISISIILAYTNSTLIVSATNCCSHASSTPATEVDAHACISGASSSNSQGSAWVVGQVYASYLCAGPSIMQVTLGCQSYVGATYTGPIDGTYSYSFYDAGSYTYGDVDINFCDGNTVGSIAYLNGACGY